MRKLQILATLYLVGTIVGAGIFGVPYVFSRSGILVGLLYCAVLAAAAVLSHLMYAEVAAATPGKHRLVGYAKKHLGRTGAMVGSLSNPLGLLGSMLAYVILGGSFLAIIFGGSDLIWSLVFTIIMSALIILPFRRLAYVEGALTWVLILVALAIIFAVTPHIRPENILQMDRAYWFLPFGVIFFSFGGVSAIPDIVESLKKDRSAYRTAIVAGTLTAVAITAFFGFTIAGASGAATSQNAVGGLVPLLGRWIVAGGAVFGILAVATSFVTIGTNLKDQFRFDFHVPRTLAWLAACGVPLALFLLGARDFVGVIGLVGAVFGATDGIIISLMARRTAKGYLRRLAIPLIVIFVVGIISELISLTR